ncbi:MAG: tyrosine--tRNA ligase [Candidatus Omnitrophica bacterium]|nr:tyrosine--tRNA ligase [Candidatus Omnitrophota bacterium]
MSPKEQIELIKRGAVEIICEEELLHKFERSQQEKRPLRIKAGFDPTAPDIHLGHTVLLRKLRQFQDLGHIVYFLIGDFTARIGDPSQRSQIRSPLGKREIIKNAQTYKRQAAKILNLRRLKTVFNSHWFNRMRVTDILELTKHTTVSQMLARADFRKRLEKKGEISLLEFMYPILQGYDSVLIKSDIEIGGTDQIFNLLVGRDLQRDFGQSPQVVITFPLLEGTDGINKMSKSLGNYIGITEKPQDMFGKIMSISDQLMYKYYLLLTDDDLNKARQLHPKEAKLKLAQFIVGSYHSEKAAAWARSEFERIFSTREVPQDLAAFELKQPQPFLEIIVQSGLVKSRNEARRLIEQGAIDFNGEKIREIGFIINSPGILRVGAHRFLKIRITF